MPQSKIGDRFVYVGNKENNMNDSHGRIGQKCTITEYSPNYICVIWDTLRSDSTSGWSDRSMNQFFRPIRKPTIIVLARSNV